MKRFKVILISEVVAESQKAAIHNVWNEIGSLQSFYLETEEIDSSSVLYNIEILKAIKIGEE